MVVRTHRSNLACLQAITRLSLRFYPFFPYRWLNSQTSDRLHSGWIKLSLEWKSYLSHENLLCPKDWFVPITRRCHNLLSHAISLRSLLTVENSDSPFKYVVCWKTGPIAWRFTQGPSEFDDKFINHYGDKAHRLLAGNGLALELFLLWIARPYEWGPLWRLNSYDCHTRDLSAVRLWESWNWMKT